MNETARHGGENLAVVANRSLSAWPTTSVRDSKGGYDGGRIRKGKISTDTLDVVAQLAGWPSPMAGTKATEDYNEAGNTDSGRKTVELASGIDTKSSNAVTEKRGVLNPNHSRWLMGFPVAWHFCGVTAMQSSRKLRRVLSKRQSKSSPN